MKGNQVRNVKLNPQALELMAALQMERHMTTAEAAEEGYLSVQEMAALVKCTEDMMYREIKKKRQLFDTVKINIAGGPTYYRLKRK